MRDEARQVERRRGVLRRDTSTVQCHSGGRAAPNRSTSETNDLRDGDRNWRGDAWADDDGAGNRRERADFDISKSIELDSKRANTATAALSVVTILPETVGSGAAPHQRGYPAGCL